MTNTPTRSGVRVRFLSSALRSNDGSRAPEKMANGYPTMNFQYSTLALSARNSSHGTFRNPSHIARPSARSTRTRNHDTPTPGAHSLRPDHAGAGDVSSPTLRHLERRGARGVDVPSTRMDAMITTIKISRDDGTKVYETVVDATGSIHVTFPAPIVEDGARFALAGFDYLSHPVRLHPSETSQ